MIRVVRGEEPKALCKARRRHLARAILAVAAGQEPRLKDYDAAKHDLYQGQHGKCAFCERAVGEAGNATEHFRPKKGRRFDVEDQVALGTDPKHYWWLAWTWENQLFACVTCNGQNNKGNWFNLEGSPLPTPPQNWRRSLAHMDLAREQPLFVDPVVDDPLEHIFWKPENEQEPDLSALRWLPYWKSKRGRETVEKILNKQDLVDQVSDHIARRVLLCIEQMDGLLARAPTDAQYRSFWAGWQRSLFAPKQPFHAAVHDALLWFQQKRGWSLPVPRPGVRPSKPRVPVLLGLYARKRAPIFVARNRQQLAALEKLPWNRLIEELAR